MRTNILITSAGKRCELLLEFKKELQARFPDAKIITADCNPIMSPACRLSDKTFKVPRVVAPEYIDSLKSICNSEDVRLIVPTIDTELLVLSKFYNFFAYEGINIMVSDESFISDCRDKRRTARLFERIGIRTPAAIDKHNPSFPLFAKPFDGSLSTNLHFIRNKTELTEEILSDEKLIFMEYIDKTEYKEFTIDMYYDANHNVKSIVPRERIEIRSGEVNKAATRKNYIVNFLKERMGILPGVRGCICIQLFYRESDNDIVGIEINPRFGGGYPLSYYAGANFPALMIKEYLCNERIEYTDNWQDNTFMLRFDSQVIFHE